MIGQRWWTPEEDTTLRRCAAVGMTRRDTAALIDRTIGGVQKRAEGLGISFGGSGSKSAMIWAAKPVEAPTLPPCELHVLAAMSEGGFPRAEIIAGRSVWIWPQLRSAA